MLDRRLGRVKGGVKSWAGRVQGDGNIQFILCVLEPTNVTGQMHIINPSGPCFT